LDYYIAWRFVNPKWSALKAMISSLAAGFFLVIPLFFEPRVETERYMKYDELNGTHIILVSRHSGIRVFKFFFLLGLGRDMNDLPLFRPKCPVHFLSTLMAMWPFGQTD
jgi:hypothetical protein